MHRLHQKEDADRFYLLCIVPVRIGAEGLGPGAFGTIPHFSHSITTTAALSQQHLAVGGLLFRITHYHG